MGKKAVNTYRKSLTPFAIKLKAFIPLKLASLSTN
jgi:hypothetical protein